MSAEFQSWWRSANLPGDPYERQTWCRTVEVAFELGRSLATPAPGAPAGGAQRWLAVVQKHAASARKNAEELRAHPSMEQEARARELAAQYLIETAQCMAMDETHAAMLQQIVDSAARMSALRAMLDAAPGAPGQEAAAAQAVGALSEHWTIRRVDKDRIFVEAAGMASATVSVMSFDALEMLLAHMAEELLAAPSGAGEKTS